MKGQSKTVLETLKKTSQPFTCRELCFACGWDAIESKNVATILTNLLLQGKVIEGEKKECSQSGRISKTYVLAENKPVQEEKAEIHQIKLESGKVLHITIKVA